MGLFDSLTGGGEIVLTPIAALALSAMTMIGADGAIEDDELAELIKIVRGNGQAFDLAFKAYKAKSVDDCVSLVAKTLTTKDQRKCALATILDIAMADGVLAGAEERLAEEYVKQFQLTVDDVRPLIAVIGIKNNRAQFS